MVAPSLEEENKIKTVY